MAEPIESAEAFLGNLCRGTAVEQVKARDAALTAAVREPLERRVRELEGQVRWFVEKAADEKLDGYRELGQRAADAENRLDDARRRIASLEAQLAAAREEALREAIRFIRSESSASESIGKHEWARFGSWLANKLTEELPPPAAQKEPSRAEPARRCVYDGTPLEPGDTVCGACCCVQPAQKEPHGR